MCDTLVAVGKATPNGTVIFGKNSDRPANESQPLVYQPRLSHDDREEETSVRCQNILIPQVKVTYGHIGSKPYWLWGYEHGVNEFGVAIGNLGVFSKEPYETPSDNAGLIGMDLVRLGLERGKNACEATHVITELLEYYGAGARGKRKTQPRARESNNAAGWTSIANLCNPEVARATCSMIGVFHCRLQMITCGYSRL
jgi:dipeptidase